MIKTCQRDVFQGRGAWVVLDPVAEGCIDACRLPASASQLKMLEVAAINR